MVLRTAYSCCGSYSEAEDITQDIFLMLHARPVVFNDDEHMKAWLLRSAINKCRNFRKSFRFSRTYSIDEENTGNHASYCMDTTDIEVRELISHLPKKYSAVLYLYFYEELTVNDIAGILKKNPNTVSSLLQRGKARLRSEIEKINETGGHHEEK
ncbi:MAG: sigma-70 family RNA polymerase sigma factor [Ruminococcus sp.]|nr:sigma-70 family RNA polymerase sigma factor [Ruminococcus sp.]MDE7225855.1 sigma-70 family RNA polymerase sigma factor [Ruminococcus sp.]